ncbi:unnamed protein product [Lymnaea stagnalis]|uniref:EGF-like domain-containing protein n=1 Tax=Lymnaea stagnalis TaxID=6523 RepID=A0AAV2I125_LYMST
MMKICVQVLFLLIVLEGISQAEGASISNFHKLNVSGQIYLVPSDKQNYKSAINSCAEIQSKLATFSTSSEYDVVCKRIREMSKKYRFYKKNKFWINFLEKRINKKPSSKFNNQYCTRISSSGLSDRDCSNSYSFLCQCELNCTELYTQTTDDITEDNSSCPPGLVPASDVDSTCVDEDECQDDPCDQNCTNTFGSYVCGCPGGFRLNAGDNSTCDDVDECLENATLCEHDCSNVPGSYLCYCPLGYKLAEDGWSCRKSPRFKSCACYCSRGNTYNFSERLAMAKTSLDAENKTEAIRYKKSLSSFRRAVTCAKDERKEASAVGSLGIVLMVLCGCAIIGPDVASAIFFLVKKFAKSE